MRFTIFSLAVLSLGLVACNTPTEEEDGGIGTSAASGLSSLFEPVPVTPGGSSVIPFPNNLLFADGTNAGGPVPGLTADATLNIPNGSENTPGSTATPVPFVTAANRTDGFSTAGSMFTDFLGFVDFATASAPANAPGLVIFNAFTGARLLPGTDYTLQESPALDGTGRAINAQRTRILIEPLKPLNPSTTYIIGVTTNLRDIYGNAATASEEFRLARSATPVANQDPAVHPILNLLTSAQEARLETVRSAVVRPTVAGFLNLYNTVHDATFPVDLTEDNLVNVWSFTTQSTTTTLTRLNAAAVAQPLFVANTGLNTNNLNPALGNTANVWVGTLQLPYYLQNPSYGATAPLTGYWKASATVLATNFPPLLPSAVPCGAFAKSDSTSICRPDPDLALGSTETVPVLVTVPNNNVCTATPDAPPLCVGGVVQKPANGWPVAIFMHGITGNRSNMFGLAPTLASAGFVTIAIDHPLHGITDTTSPLYRNQLFAGTPAAALQTSTERTFNLDFQDNTPDAANPCLASNNQPDTVIDSSGAWYFNLSSLTTSRDNLRQSVSDVITLTKSIANLDLDQNPGALTAADIDETRIFFVGQSLGAIAGTIALGVNTDIGAASLHVPGGGIARMLDASISFGPRIAAGLGCSGVVEGTDSYESFVRFAQHLIDPVDPINFAVQANANHAIHMVEVIGDLVIPNTALASATTTATQHRTLISGFLSGTDPLYERMGLTVAAELTPPGTAGAGAADTVVPFALGTAQHTTLLTPDRDSTAGNGNDTDFICATREMQRQTATFLATNGAGFTLGGPTGAPCP